jgi:multiple sugar transport system permease protein
MTFKSPNEREVRTMAPLTVPSEFDASPQAVCSPVTPTEPRRDREPYRWSSLLLLGPATILLLGLFVGPSLYAFYLGFTNLKLLGPTAIHFQFTGRANLNTLIHDSTFIGSLGITGLFVLGSVVGAIVVGMLLALAMRSGSRITRVVVGGVVVVCWMMPAVSAGFAWYATSTAGGIISSLLGSPRTDLLATSPLLVVIIANIWSQTGFVMLVFGAGLRNIPGEVLEAARVENASPWQSYWRISLPMMWPLVTTTVLIVVLLSLGNFSLVYIMTQGGPGTATNILPIYSYVQGFTYDNLAYGALIGDALVVVATIFAFVYVRASKVKI